MEKLRSLENVKLAIAPILAISLGFTACGVDKTPDSTSPNISTEMDVTKLQYSVCQESTMYSQNRFAPFGAAVRTEPSIKAEQLYGVIPNGEIVVDGWVASGTETYPQNTPPFNNDVWFHVAALEINNVNERVEQNLWVSFPGVRSRKTSPDPLQGYGTPGPAAKLLPECETEY